MFTETSPGSFAVAEVRHRLRVLAPTNHHELIVARHRRSQRRLPGIGGWTAQYRTPLYDGVRGVVDLAWPGEQVVVELDGRRWHITAQAQGDDCRRDRAATAHGWVTLRFGWAEVVHRPAAFVAECRLVLAARQAERAPGAGAG